jgi:serine/threonine protein kinase
MDKWRLEDDGSLQINGTQFKVANLRIEKKIGQGASGVVFLCENTVLHRKEALKIWLHLRKWDTRNKTIQGHLEAIKAASARGSVPAVYYADIWEGYFFATMEFIVGRTLKAHLQRNTPTLLQKKELAWEYINLIFSFGDIIHGDPHPGNVMVLPNGNMVLLDFGTSTLRGIKNNEHRHWQLVQETFSKIMEPFSFASIMGHLYGARPDHPDAYYHFLDEFFDMLWSIGLRPEGRGMSVTYHSQKRECSGLDLQMRRALKLVLTTNRERFADKSFLGFPWFE